MSSDGSVFGSPRTSDSDDSMKTPPPTTQAPTASEKRKRTAPGPASLSNAARSPTLDRPLKTRPNQKQTSGKVPTRRSEETILNQKAGKSRGKSANAATDQPSSQYPKAFHNPINIQGASKPSTKRRRESVSSLLPRPHSLADYDP